MVRRSGVMRTFGAVTLALICFALSALGSSASDLTTLHLPPCYAHAMTQEAINRCASTALRSAQNELSTLLLSEAKFYGRASVNAAQDAWASYETAECTLQAKSNTGGSIYESVYMGCEQSLTMTRIAEVREDIKNRPR